MTRLALGLCLSAVLCIFAASAGTVSGAGAPMMPEMPCTFSTEYVERMTYRATTPLSRRLAAVAARSNVAARVAAVREAQRRGTGAELPEVRDYEARLMWYMAEGQAGNQEMDNSTYIWEAPATFTLVSPFFERQTCVRLESRGTPAIHCPQFPNRAEAKHDRVDACPNQRDRRCDVWVWWSSDLSMTQEAFMVEGTNVLDLVTIETEDYSLREDFLRMNTTKPDAAHFRPPPDVPCTDLTSAPDAPARPTWARRPASARTRARPVTPLASLVALRTDPLRLRRIRTAASAKGSAAAPAVPSGSSMPKAIPESFDARTQWPQCATMRAVRDQGHCGSCWAFGAAEAFGDRYCVATNASVVFSPQHMVDCYAENSGCMGGYLDSTWYAVVRQGVVTEACKPYTAESHACDAVCNDTQHSRPAYFFAERAYSVFVPFDHARNVRAIQQEILARGPVEAAFYVLADFRDYAGGVYHRTAGAAFQGGHAIKIVGWGVDAATRMPYWTVANSWGEDWGENGFFRIRRGTNECGIESEIAIGTIKI